MKKKFPREKITVEWSPCLKVWDVKLDGVSIARGFRYKQDANDYRRKVIKALDKIMKEIKK